MRSALDLQQAQQQTFLSLFEQTAQHLSKCTDLVKKTNRFDDQSSAFVRDGAKLLEDLGQCYSRTASGTLSMLNTIKAQYHTQEQTQVALRGAYDLLQRLQRAG